MTRIASLAISWLRDLPIAFKFTSITAVLVVAFISMGIAFFSVTSLNRDSRSEMENIVRFGERSDQVAIGFLEMRQHEKDFILRTDPAILPIHEAAFDAVEEQLGLLIEDAPTSDKAEMLEELSMYMSIYRGSFSEMAAAMEELGYDQTSGLHGDAIEYIGAVQSILSNYSVAGISDDARSLRQRGMYFLVHPTEANYQDVVAEESALEESLKGVRLSAADSDALVENMLGFRASLEMFHDASGALADNRATFDEVAAEFGPILDRIREDKNALVAQTKADAGATQNRIEFIFFAVIVITCIVVCGSFMMLSFAIRRPLDQALSLAQSISTGELGNTVTVVAKDETGDLLIALDEMQKQLRDQQQTLKHQLEENERRAEESRRVAEESERQAEVSKEVAEASERQAEESKRIAADAAEQAEEFERLALESGRIKQALDGVSSPVLMFNRELKVAYINDAATAMFEKGQSEIRDALPGFDAASVLGQGPEYLYPDGLKQRQMLNELASSKTDDVLLGARSYRVTVSPVIDAGGERIGIVAEWQDRTDEVAVEQEVNAIVQAAREGNLSQRIDLSNKDGFIYGLSDGVNELVGVSERVISDTVDALSRIARGDLTQKMEGEYSGIFAQLKSDVNTTFDQLCEVVEKIQTGSTSVASASARIANGNSALSVRTEQQAASLEQTAAAMEEMTATVRGTADNVRQADELVLEARQQAKVGGDVVGKAVEAMAGINEASARISNIISVIDEISFQTNLLALNAAVEAARAGEQGRSFAVVASEVRDLAGHSAQAAKEIKDLITDSSLQVEKGSELVNQSGEALTAIVDSVEKVTAIMGEISAASSEQADGIEQVSNSVNAMDEGTRQTAVMVDDVTGESGALGKQAEELQEMMSFFSVSHGSKAPLSVAS